jgi:hypothetical protein
LTPALGPARNASKSQFEVSLDKYADVMKRVIVFTLGICLLGQLSSTASDSAKSGSIKASLQIAPAPEMPMKAAQLVKQAGAKEREQVTADVVMAAAEINPAAAPAVVGAIARAVPEMAARAASVAATAQPKLASAIARAAAAAAPSQAAGIVAAVCKAVPHDYRNIASSVAQAAPGSGREILEAVGSAIPELNYSIALTVAGYNGNVASVPAALDQAAKTAPPQPAVSATIAQPGSTPVLAGNRTVAATPATPAVPTTLASTRPRPPTVGPPYIPLSGTPTNVTPGTGGEVPPGGRNYAAP